MHPTPSGEPDGPEVGAPLQYSIHLGARYWSPSDREERPHAKRPRCAPTRAYWSSRSLGTGSASVAGAARTRQRHSRARKGRKRERDRETESEGERKRMNLGRALRRECSRAGNQCRFRGSGGHHAADYADYTDYICTRPLTVVSFRGDRRALYHLIPSVSRDPRRWSACLIILSVNRRADRRVARGATRGVREFWQIPRNVEGHRVSNDVGVQYPRARGRARRRQRRPSHDDSLHRPEVSRAVIRISVGAETLTFVIRMV